MNKGWFCKAKPGSGLNKLAGKSAEACEPSHPEKKNAVVNVFRWWYSLITQF